MSSEQMEMLGRASFVQRMAEMLLDCGSVDPDCDRRVLGTMVAEALDEAEQNGIKTERLMGMYVILKISDGIDPYMVPEYAKVLQAPTLEEADKAHLIQMLRIGELSPADLVDL